LVVTGDLEGRALEALRSYWLIGGNIAAETAWLSTYGLLFQRGDLRTRLLVLQQHFEVRHTRSVEAATRIETDYLPKDAAAQAKLAELLQIEGLTGEDGQLDSWALLDAVSRGEPVFR
jgi:hypothetical protein